jgi:hypothetical protein
MITDDKRRDVSVERAYNVAKNYHWQEAGQALAAILV